MDHNFQGSNKNVKTSILVFYTQITLQSMALRLYVKRAGGFFKTNILIVDYTSVSPKIYFAKNLPRNLLLSIALIVKKLQFGGLYWIFVTVNAVLNKSFSAHRAPNSQQSTSCRPSVFLNCRNKLKLRVSPNEHFFINFEF